MAERLYRAQILLEPEQHKVLADMAQKQGRSISEVVREIIRERLAERTDDLIWEQRKAALRKLDQIREEASRRYGVYQGDLLATVRQEREEELLRVWKGEE